MMSSSGILSGSGGSACSQHHQLSQHLTFSSNHFYLAFGPALKFMQTKEAQEKILNLLSYYF
jgi:hypothetical protein